MRWDRVASCKSSTETILEPVILHPIDELFGSEGNNSGSEAGMKSLCQWVPTQSLVQYELSFD